MKTSLCAFAFGLFLMCGGSAFGQSVSVLTNNPQPFTSPDDRPLHAAEHAMGSETSLLSLSSISYAKGEVPLAELASPVYHTPLGDIAREYKKEHAMLPKATRIAEN
jgi:hypothetical protein